MPLVFVGVDSESKTGQSPTVWRYSETGDLLVQSYTATAEEIRECRQAGFGPGHSTEVPPHETIIRIPARMIPILKEACDAPVGPHLG
ncbi:hypothetical protein AB0G74_26115 [Streptomyces sp. NPDC020875]|uniref:hypothetical protein n=1 Tax=Streptomyces sp. NPDC020875 TaxID=3154898 RepID=UPI0033E9AA45